MSFEIWLGGIAALVVTVYLVYVLLHPERF